MWRVTQALGYSSPGVDGECDMYGMSGRPTVTPLDPIDASLVGAARIATIESMCRRHLPLLSSKIRMALPQPQGAEAPWLRNARRMERDVSADVSRNYYKHLQALLEARILRRRSAQEVHFTSGYFAVPKTDQTSRSIFNGKRLSKNFEPPAPVNIMDVSEVVSKIQASHGKAQFHVVTGDLRHWFHQIPTSAELQDFFGLKRDQEFYSWCSLPMGWSWSPLIAQACAWGFLAYRRDDEEPLLDEHAFRESCGMPRWVRTAKGGWMTVYYDNFFIVTPDEKEANMWHQRIEENARRLHVVIKENTLQKLDPAKIRNEGFEFLGVQYRLEGDTLRWEPLKRTSWLERLGKQAAGGTWRDAAGWLGRSIFAVTSSGLSFHRHANSGALVTLARKLGKEAPGHWDEPAGESFLKAVLSVAHVVILTAQYSASAKELKQANKDRDYRRRVGITLATDSSSTGWGFCGYDNRSGSLLHEPLAHGGPWPASDDRHIFLKEMHAALKGLTWARATKKRVHTLVVDNAAVFFALKNGITSSVEGQRLLLAIQKLPAEQLPEEVVLVGTRANPADCPSRAAAKPGEMAERSVAMWEAVKLSWAGGQRSGDAEAYLHQRHTDEASLATARH